jgi:hypothetical protein
MRELRNIRPYEWGGQALETFEVFVISRIGVFGRVRAFE